MTEEQKNEEVKTGADPATVELGGVAEEKPQVGNPGTADLLTCWEPEDESFWNTYGEKIAFKTLSVSTPNLTLMFATWLMWSIVAALIQGAHDKDPTVYPLTDYVDYVDVANPTKEELKQYKIATSMLPSLAGLVGASLRVVNTFMVAICGTRMHNTMNSFIAMVPMFGIFVLLRDKDVTFRSLVLLAGMSGIGGGAFASSMSSISFFFPKRKQGLALGINAGLGNLGVSLSQLLVPLVATGAYFGPLSGDALSAQAEYYVQNAGLSYMVLLCIFSALAFLTMHTKNGHGSGGADPAAHSVILNLLNYSRMELMGFLGGFTGVGIFILSVPYIKGPALVITRIFLLAAFCCILTLVFLYIGAGAEVQKKLKTQSVIFKDQHTWWQTYLYIMTFGSFIGYSSAFPKLIKDVYGYKPDGSENLGKDPVFGIAMNGAASKFAWMGPCVGSLARPLGGWLSDKFSGAAVTHWGTIVETLSTIGAGYFVSRAAGSATPEDHFYPFLICFLLLFTSTGSSNGSTFRQMTVLFPPEQAGPVLGWTSAVAAYGAAVFPAVFGAAGSENSALVLYLFAFYYFTCLLVNWYFYYEGIMRPGKAPRPC
jgi:NNP family nitrate/nitrite transporter-like MFS transporter